jgi:hypothetical protein
MSASVLYFIIGFCSQVVIGTTLSITLKSRAIGVTLGIFASIGITATLVLCGVG